MYKVSSVGFNLTSYTLYRAEKEMRDASGNSGPITASPKHEKSHLGLEDCPNQSSMDEIPEQNPCPPEHNIGTVNFQVMNLI